jgi:hypothetical protein
MDTESWEGVQKCKKMAWMGNKCAKIARVLCLFINDYKKLKCSAKNERQILPK